MLLRRIRQLVKREKMPRPNVWFGIVSVSHSEALSCRRTVGIRAQMSSSGLYRPTFPNLREDLEVNRFRGSTTYLCLFCTGRWEQTRSYR